MSGMPDQKIALDYLWRNPLLHMGMIEPINRGTAKILYSGSGGVLLYEEKSKAYMISVDAPDTAERVLKRVPKADLFLAHQQFCVPLIEKCFGINQHFDFLQAVYLKKDLIEVENKIKIKKLTKMQEPIVLEHYHTMDDPDYLKQLISDELMYGAFVNDALAGFIGIHAEGSIGLLEVLPEFRRQGIGCKLEAYIINDMVRKGRIPYCQVSEENLNSLNLQKKLGLEFSDSHLFWLF